MIKDKKRCPLTYVVGKGAYDQEVASFDCCKEEECAWWDNTYEPYPKCAILTIAIALVDVVDIQDEVKKNENKR